MEVIYNKYFERPQDRPVTYLPPDTIDKLVDAKLQTALDKAVDERIAAAVAKALEGLQPPALPPVATTAVAPKQPAPTIPEGQVLAKKAKVILERCKVTKRQRSPSPDEDSSDDDIKKVKRNRQTCSCPNCSLPSCGVCDPCRFPTAHKKCARRECIAHHRPKTWPLHVEGIIDNWRRSVFLARGRLDEKIVERIPNDVFDWNTESELRRLLGKNFVYLKPNGHFAKAYVDKIRKELPTPEKSGKKKKK